MAKVLILSCVDKRTDFIELQRQSYARFMKDEFQLVILNNSADPEMAAAIEQKCNELNVTHVKVVDHGLRLGEAHAAALNWGIKNVAFPEDCDFLFLADFDLFLYRDFSVSEFMSGFDIAGIGQWKGPGVDYLWPGLVLINMRTIPNKDQMNFDCGRVDDYPVDVGGQMCIYFRNNPGVKKKIMRNSGHINSEKMAAEYFPEKLLRAYVHDPYFNFSIMEAFLHYGAGTNWDHRTADFVRAKTDTMYYFINTCIAEDVMKNVLTHKRN